MNTPSRLPSIAHLISRTGTLLAAHGIEDLEDNCREVVGHTVDFGDVYICHDRDCKITTIKPHYDPNLEEPYFFKFGDNGYTFDRTPDTLLTASKVLDQLEESLKQTE